MLLLAGCYNEEKTEIDKTVDMNFYNQTLGGGFATKNDSYIYLASTDLNLYEIDLNNFDALKIGQDLDGRFLNIKDNTLYYSDSENFNLKSVQLEDFSSQTIYSESPVFNMYVSDHYAYAITSVMGSLFRVDLNTGEYTELIEDSVLQYAKYGDDIYYITEIEDGDGSTILKKYNENSEQTEQIEVGICPITVFVDENNIYMSEQGTYRLYRYQRDSRQTEPVGEIHTLYYQVRNDVLYYMDEDDREENYTLKEYELDNGTTSNLDENVYYFEVFEDDSLITWIPGAESGSEYHYITQNGSSVEKKTIK